MGLCPGCEISTNIAVTISHPGGRPALRLNWLDRTLRFHVSGITWQTVPKDVRSKVKEYCNSLVGHLKERVKGVTSIPA